MNRSVSSFAAALSFGAALVGSGCLVEKDELPKGEVDESLPPGTALAVHSKAGDQLLYTLNVQSQHPYANNLQKSFVVDLAAAGAPTCDAMSTRLHFASLRTEQGYDFVHIDSPLAGRVQSLTGNQDGVWTEWVDLDSTQRMSVVLESDASVRRDGFVIDQAEYSVAKVCPRIAIQMCAEGTVDINGEVPLCGCPQQPTCVALSDIEIEHSVGGGFTGAVTGKRVSGSAAFTTAYGPNTPDSITAIGTIDPIALAELVREIALAGWLTSPDVIESSNWNETVRVRVGSDVHTFVRPAGSFSADDQAVITRFEELFTCAGVGAALTCGAGNSCVENACVVDQGCFCPQHYVPVCGVDNHTYGNSCSAGCAGVGVAHDGECGIAGDSCGTILGLGCLEGNKCRYAASTFDAPHPDAGGLCVAGNYCDAPVDCSALPHIAVPGTWACEQATCAWKVSAQWTDLAGWSFATAHPYASNESIYKSVTLPAGATKLRLVSTGTFNLEQGYDKLEVFVRVNGAWSKVKTYTGTVAPAATDELVGTEFSLHFVSDSSVTKHGFSLTAQYN
jgi:Kazal-type serine protease inhibitor-like protein